MSFQYPWIYHYDVVLLFSWRKKTKEKSYLLCRRDCGKRKMNLLGCMCFPTYKKVWDLPIHIVLSFSHSSINPFVSNSCSMLHLVGVWLGGTNVLWWRILVCPEAPAFLPNTVAKHLAKSIDIKYWYQIMQQEIFNKEGWREDEKKGDRDKGGQEGRRLSLATTWKPHLSIQNKTQFVIHTLLSMLFIQSYMEEKT